MKQSLQTKLEDGCNEIYNYAAAVVAVATAVVGRAAAVAGLALEPQRGSLGLEV